MSDKPKVLPPQSGDVERLMRDQLQRHNLRLKPTETVATVIEAMAKDGLALREEFGTLIGAVGDQVANIPQCIENWSTKNTDKFFPRDISTVTSLDQMDRQARVDFLKKYGETAYARLPKTAADVPPTELDPSKLTSSQYRRLPAATKAECVKQWGVGAISRIIARK